MLQTEPKLETWDSNTLTARIADPRTRKRHAAGSPDPHEVAAYGQCLALPQHVGTALVLGMTPELRRLALQSYRRVISIDRNADAVSLYRDWVDPEDADREAIVLAEWQRLRAVIPGRVHAVLGDGIFANLPDPAAHSALLESIHRLLHPDGVFATRISVIPDGFDLTEYTPDALLHRFRTDQLNAAEFGFGMRKMAFLDRFYGEKTYVLNNAAVFAQVEYLFETSQMTFEERDAVRRYYFAGPNTLLPQRVWEELLREAGFNFRRRICGGRDWYRYYMVYECRP